MNNWIGWILGAVAAVAFAGPVNAAEVKLPYRGLTLNANLELASGKSVKDGVVLLTHGTQAHGGMEILNTFQSLLRDKGYSSLAINLSLGIDNRHGMYDCSVPSRYRQSDALDEIGAWLDWLERQGATQVTLLGHSRGGNQTAWFLAERDRPVVKAAILVAPAVDADQDAKRYRSRFGKPLEPLLARAQSLVKAGKGDTLLEHVGFLLVCDDTAVTAGTFVSYYAPDPRRDTSRFLSKLRKPTLVLVAGNDELVVGVGEKVKPHADGKRVQMKVIDGADHFFRDLYAEDAVDAIHAFLSGS
jgi:pimeloyl-ACP methyl ester carboxylesterase